MAKAVDKEKLKKTLKLIEKDRGEGSVHTMKSKKSRRNIPRWSTGLEALDEILGGGMPEGRVVEISGNESAGKTSLAYHLMAQHRYAVDIPIEGTFDEKRAEIFGNSKGQLIVDNADYGEQVFESIKAYTDINMPIVVVDSVPAMVPREQYEETNMEKENRIGRIPAMMSARLPAIVRKCEESGTTLIFINQMRDKIGAMPFGEKTQQPGGWALKHACSVKIRISRVRWIKVPNKNPRNDATNEMVGIEVKIKITKSKVCTPLGECMLALFFDRGFVPMSEKDNIRKEIMAANNEKYNKRRKRKNDEDE